MKHYKQLNKMSTIESILTQKQINGSEKAIINSLIDQVNLCKTTIDYIRAQYIEDILKYKLSMLDKDDDIAELEEELNEKEQECEVLEKKFSDRGQFINHLTQKSKDHK